MRPRFPARPPAVLTHIQLRVAGGWAYELLIGPFETREEARAAMERTMEMIRRAPDDRQVA